MDGEREFDNRIVDFWQKSDYCCFVKPIPGEGNDDDGSMEDKNTRTSCDGMRIMIKFVFAIGFKDNKVYYTDLSIHCR